MTVLREISAPHGRLVELTVERWAHIVHPDVRHPEVLPHQDEIVRAIAAPDEVRPGRPIERTNAGIFSATAALPRDRVRGGAIVSGHDAGRAPYRHFDGELWL